MRCRWVDASSRYPHTSARRHRPEAAAQAPLRETSERATGPRVGQTLGLSGDGIAHQSIKQDFQFDLTVEDKQPISELVERVSDVQALVSIALDRSATFESVTFEHPDVVQELELRRTT